MKNMLNFMITVATFLFMTQGMVAQTYFSEEIVKIWETPADFKVPESVFYDAANDVIYVANINGKPLDKDGNGFISKLKPDGTIMMLNWVGGLNAPKGMGTSNGKLYVSDIDRVARIDILTGKTEKFYKAKDAEFLNDIAIGNDGTVYISDMGRGLLYRIRNDQIEELFPFGTFSEPNGLYFDEGSLFAGCHGSIMKINPLTKEFIEIAKVEGGIDGLERDKDGNFIFSDWSGCVRFLKPGGESRILLNTTEAKINAADIFLIRAKDILLVPTFFDNRVMAYQVQIAK